jgi:hypothetical protein
MLLSGITFCIEQQRRQRMGSGEKKLSTTILSSSSSQTPFRLNPTPSVSILATLALFVG